MRFGLTAIAVFMMLVIQSISNDINQIVIYVGYGTLLFAGLLEIASLYKGISSD